MCVLLIRDVAGTSIVQYDCVQTLLAAAMCSDYDKDLNDRTALSFLKDASLCSQSEGGCQ